MVTIEKQQSVFLRTATPKGEAGYVLVLTMFILVVLSIIGLSATRLSRLELFVAGNDRLHKETYYQADGGTEIGTRLTYDNAICSQVNDGFDEKTVTPGQRAFNDIMVYDLDFGSPFDPGTTTVSDTTDGSQRAFAYYPGGSIDDTTEHTNVLVSGNTGAAPGSGLQMVSGYEGLGASSIGGGTRNNYTIYSEHNGQASSQSRVVLGWQLSAHIINAATTQDCKDIYKGNN